MQAAAAAVAVLPQIEGVEVAELGVSAHSCHYTRGFAGGFIRTFNRTKIVPFQEAPGNQALRHASPQQTHRLRHRGAGRDGPPPGSAASRRRAGGDTALGRAYGEQAPEA